MRLYRGRRQQLGFSKMLMLGMNKADDTATPSILYALEGLGNATVHTATFLENDSIVYLAPPVALGLALLMTSAAAPFSLVIMNLLHARLGIKPIEGYSLSETSPGASMMPLRGELFPSRQAKLLDVDDSKRE
ncbi:hypothetical protein PG994_010719 [Apiospora phragmitis]|uniref:Uncharacterized protein n=1 Tax=Apiospora phragmitis TaxID=2905665 RepID=A0ABR1TQR1_9PEZI